MPQRRSLSGYSGISDGESYGARPAQAMPMTGTGTGTDADAMYATSVDPYAEQVPGQESPTQLRRRLMPVSGAVDGGMGALDLLQAILARRGGM